MSRLAVGFPILCAFGLGCSAAAPPTVELAPAPIEGTREDLEQALTHFEAMARVRESSDELRDQARDEAALVRRRLEEGDFQPGDRISLLVEGEAELSDTFAVRTGRVLMLPGIGEMPLHGVLRSELEPHLRERLGRFLNDPVIHARALIRIAVSGEVASPGYYMLPTDVIVTDALMAAGGPTRDAKLTEIRVERDGRPVWAGDDLQERMALGRTLDQLDVRPGDRIHVPKKGGFNVVGATQMAALATTLVLGLVRIF